MTVEGCVAAGDNGSRELLEKILLDEEHHIDWLEGQLHAIDEMGIENYLRNIARRRRVAPQERPAPVDAFKSASVARTARMH